VLTFDDFHRADEHSVEPVDQLTRLPLDAPVLMVIAYQRPVLGVVAMGAGSTASSTSARVALADLVVESL
jgi:hypothetical protein